jgi:acyl carrier protein
LSNYVAANAFLEGLAERARRQGVPATCIAWGGWSGVGMASRLSERWLKRWRERGVEGLDCEDLRCALDGAVAGATPANLLVADISWDRCARQLSPRARRMVADLVDRPAAAPKDDRPRAAPLNLADIVDPLERRERIRVEVRRLCLTALELPSHFHLEPGTPLADLGLDSLLALELREKLNSAFEVDLPETILFDCPSAEAITARLIAVSAAPQA